MGAVESDRQRLRSVSRVGSRFALIMLFAAVILGVVLTAMSAIQLRQVHGFSKQLLGMRARGAATSFFIRYMRQPERTPERIHRIVDEAALGAADYIQVLSSDGTLHGSFVGESTGTLPEPDPALLREACRTGFRRLDQQLDWKQDGTVRLGRGVMGAMVRPARAEMVELDDHPVLDAYFALPGPELLKKCALMEPNRPRKCKGMILVRDEMLESGAPCMIVRVGVDATAQKRAVHTHWWILGLAILTTLVILGINMALYRTLKQREREAESLRRTRRLESLGEMAATLAHELKNPVGAIRGYAQLMREAHEAGDLAADDPDRERIQRAVETMVRESQRLEELVRRTLEFARPGDLELTTFDLRDVAGEAAALLAKKAEERSVSIVTDHEASAVTVKADRSRIEQVLANLLDNAIEASTEDGNVVIAVRSGSEGAICEVRDRGLGIDPMKLEEIFQPFTTTRTDGTGLGLAVSRSIVEAHRGTVRASSAGEGQGAVFTVTLPR